MITERQRSLLVLNGVGLLASAIIIGWFYFIFLLEGVRLWPFIIHMAADVPGDRRAWNMAHLEAITNGTILIAIAMAAPYIKLGRLASRLVVWGAITFGWLFTLPAAANAWFGTRGLAFDGGPFEGGLANNLIFLSGWPAFLGVHIALPLLVWGAYQHFRSTPKGEG